MSQNGVEDYGYAEILENLIEEAEAIGLNTGEAVAAMAMFQRQSPNPVNWRLSDAYWEDARQAAAKAIVNLVTPQIIAFEFDSSTNTVTVSWSALPSSNYQLYNSDSLVTGIQWSAAPGSYTVTAGTATQTFTIESGVTTQFFKVKTLQ